MSDRGTFLGNAAAAAMAKMSSFSSFGFAAKGQEVADPTLSDREKAGLRGPVKNVEEKFSQYSTGTEYSPDGRSLSWRITPSTGAQSIKTWTYDADGRLAKITRGGPANFESLYAYDETSARLRTTELHGNGTNYNCTN
jgi:YD repeat-containing protein